MTHQFCGVPKHIIRIRVVFPSMTGQRKASKDEIPILPPLPPHVIMSLTSCLVLLFMLCQTASANPMAVDTGREMTPMPHSETAVYLKSERVIVHVDDLAQINATYTFHNDGNESTDLTIYLPFKSKPRNVFLGLENETLDHTFIEFDPNGEYPDQQYIRDLMENFSSTVFKTYGIVFTLSFEAGEERTIRVTYDRTYAVNYQGPASFWLYRSDTSGWDYYEFRYIIATAVFWNHSIDSMVFELWIPKDLLYEVVRYYQPIDDIVERDGYWLARTEFTNWTPRYEHLWAEGGAPGAYWRVNNTDGEMGPFESIWYDVTTYPSTCGIYFFSTIILLAVVVAQLNRMRNPWYIPRSLLRRINRVREGNPRQSKAHGEDHHRRVWERSRAIAKEVMRKEGGKLDLEALSLAAVMHDIDQPYDNKRNHAIPSAILAGKILESANYPIELIEKVQDIIREHSSEDGNPPATLAGKILFDADKLDGLGKIGVERVFALCSWMGLSEEETIEWYERKIEKALPLMQTDIAREMGKEDLEYTRQFIHDFRERQKDGEGEGGRRCRKSIGEKKGMRR